MVRYLCARDERRSVSLLIWNKGSPNKPLSTLVPKDMMAVPTVGHDSAHVAGTLHRGIHHCFSAPLWKELRAYTHTSCFTGLLISDRKGLSAKMCYLLSPNYLLFTRLLRIINLSPSIRAGDEFFYEVNSAICSFAAALLAAELALHGWMT